MKIKKGRGIKDMEVLERNKKVVVITDCPICGSTLKIERRDLRIKYGGFTGTMQIPYITCPVCKTELGIEDKELYRFGLQRSY